MAAGEELGKREKTKKKNRENILQAAKAVFLEQGYDATTVRDIIRQTGLATGTFYNYFKDKESIFRAIIDDYMLALSMEVREDRVSAKNLEEFITSSCKTFFSNVSRDPVSYELYRRNENVIGDLYEISVMEEIQKELISDIEKAIELGYMPKTNSRYLAASFFGVSRELSRLLRDGSEKDAEAAAEFAAALFLNGIRGLPGKK